MFHELPEQFLYSSYFIDTQFAHPDGTTKAGSATAFVLEVAPKTPWIVTNRHVIDIDYRQRTPKYKDFRLAHFSITGRRSDDSVYTFDLHSNAKCYFHNDRENDVVLIQPYICLDTAEGALNSFHWHYGLEFLADEKVFSESIRPFDLICYTGFPDQHDKLGNRPILRSGHIASDPKYDYSWDQLPHGRCVAYEGFSSSGASGSPILAPPRGMHGIPNSRHGFLIGVNAGHVPTQPQGHSGISYFYKSTIILDIIEQNGLDKMS